MSHDEFGQIETCDACGRPVPDHLVSEWRDCLATLHDHTIDYNEPTAGVPVETEIQTIMAGSIVVKAAAHTSPVGVFPVLVFEFTTPDGPLPQIALLLDDPHMRDVSRLISQSVDGAVKAAQKMRG